MSEEEIKKILNQIIKRNGVTFFGYTSKEVGNIAIKEALNLIDKLQTKYEKQKKINLEQNQFIDTLKTNIIKLQKENTELKEKILAM